MNLSDLRQIILKFLKKLIDKMTYTSYNIKVAYESRGEMAELV